MPVRVDKRPDEPIIIATLSGHVTVEDIQELFRRSDEILQTIRGRAFRITDFRSADTSFQEAVHMIKVAASNNKGSSADPRIKGVVLGKTHWTKFYTDLMRRDEFGGLTIPVFESMPEALRYVHNELGMFE